MNTGKQFEADFKASIPSDAWCYRLKDSAATYYGGNENLSFSIDNICDFLVYRYPMNHLFELKTIETPSIPLEKVFGKYDKAMLHRHATIQGQARVYVDTDSAKADAADKNAKILLRSLERKHGQESFYCNWCPLG